jgi:hypothetical protein
MKTSASDDGTAAADRSRFPHQLIVREHLGAAIVEG